MGRNYQQYTYQDYTTTKNAIGEEEKTFGTVGTLTGHIYQLSGDEQYESNKDTRIIKYRFHGDDPSFDVTEEGRVLDNNKEYDIEVINEMDKLGYKKVEMDLKVVE